MNELLELIEYFYNRFNFVREPNKRIMLAIASTIQMLSFIYFTLKVDLRDFSLRERSEGPVAGIDL